MSYGAGDGNRTNPNEPNKGVTTRSTVQLESNGVKSKRASFSVDAGQNPVPGLYRVNRARGLFMPSLCTMTFSVRTRVGLWRALGVVRPTAAPDCFLSLRDITSTAQTHAQMGFHVLALLLFAGHLLFPFRLLGPNPPMAAATRSK